MDPLSTYQTSSNIQIAVSALWVATLIGLLGFIVFEGRQTSRSFSWVKAANPFNILLVILFTANISLHGVSAFRFSYQAKIQASNGEIRPTIASKLVAFVVQNTSLYAMCLCYINYSWLRGKGVFEEILPKFVPALHVFMWTMPIIYITAISTSATGLWFIYGGTATPLALSYFSMVINLLAATFTVLFDILILTTFTWYLQKTRTDGEAIDERFQIISKFGVGSSITALVTFILDLMSFFVPMDETISDVVFQIMLCGFDTLAMILFWMKVALYFNKKAQSNARISGANHNRNTATGEDGRSKLSGSRPQKKSSETGNSVI